MAESYDAAYGDLGAVYDPQVALLQQQSIAADTNATAQQASLDQAKVNAFKDIDNSANAKGVLFSGFSPDQQATYLGTKYLPAVANLKAATLNTKQTLASKIATLYGQRSQAAQQSVAQQQKDEQDAAYKQAQLQLGYARLAASQSAGANKPLTQQQVTSGINQGLMSVRGRDGYVSPQDYAKAQQDWVNAGFAASAFNSTFKQYRNPNNPYYPYAVRTAK